MSALTNDCSDARYSDFTAVAETSAASIEGSDWNNATMLDLYTIVATPSHHADGEYAGKLRGVTFNAVSASETHQWFTRNCGHFEQAFRKIMPEAHAQDLMHALLQGSESELPGLYFDHQFARGFMFEWSPVYSVAPTEAMLNH